jgi:hypothetical protein
MWPALEPGPDPPGLSYSSSSRLAALEMLSFWASLARLAVTARLFSPELGVRFVYPAGVTAADAASYLNRWLVLAFPPPPFALPFA